MADSPAVRKLARRLYDLEKGQRALASQPRLPFSSMEGGALDVYDTDGSLRASVGEQPDGTAAYVSLNGVTPPKPTLPMVSTGAGVLHVYWDGTFANGRPAPLDFSRVLAYALPLADYSAPEPTNQTLIVGGFQSALGGEFSFPATPGVEYAVYLVAWNQAGQYGAASDVAFGTSLPAAGPSGPDGDPPGSSPVPLVQGLVGSLLASWPAVTNEDAVTYEVHVKTGTTPPAAGDAGSLLLETASTQATIRTLPGGAALNYDTDYNVWVIARDADGPGPVAGYGTGRMRKVTGPDVSAEYVYAGNVSATQISAGNLDAVLALVGRLVTAKAGRRVEIGNDGIVIREQNEDLLISFPTDPEGDFSINADVTAKRLNVLTGGDFGGFVKVKTAGVLELGSAVGGSAVPPQAVVDWTPGRKTVAAPSTVGTRGSYTSDTGWLGEPGYRVGGVNASFSGSPGGDRIDIWQGTVTQVSNLLGWFPRTVDANADGSLVGCVKTGSTLYVLQRKSDASATDNRYVVRKYSLSGFTPSATGAATPTLSATFTYTAPVYGNNYLPSWQWPAIGRDDSAAGSYVIVCWDQANSPMNADLIRFDNRYRAQRFNASGVQQSNTLCAAITMDGEAQQVGCYYGQGDVNNGTSYIWIAGALGRTYTFVLGGTRNTQQEFDLDGRPNGVSFWPGATAGTGGIQSMVGGDANFTGGLAALIETMYSPLNWTTESSKWWAGYTWRDATGTTPDTALPGYTHESTLSALAGFTMKKRAYVTLTAPPLPGSDPASGDDPTGVQWYLHRQDGSATPAPGALWKQTTQPVAGLLTWRLGWDAATAQFSGVAHPPTVTSFPSGVAALIRPESTTTLAEYAWVLKGDGSGRAGPLRWDAQGERVDVDPMAYGFLGTDFVLATGTSTHTLINTGWTNSASIDVNRPGAAAWTYADGVWTVPKDGLYLCMVTLHFVSNSAGGVRSVAIYRSGSNVARFQAAGSTTSGVSVMAQRTFNCVAGDTLDIRALQTSGANATIDGTSANSHFSFRRIGPRF